MVLNSLMRRRRGAGDTDMLQTTLCVRRESSSLSRWACRLMGEWGVEFCSKQRAKEKEIKRVVPKECRRKEAGGGASQFLLLPFCDRSRETLPRADRHFSSLFLGF